MDYIKRFHISLISILIIQIVIVIFFGFEKERLNVDEVFTYQGAKNAGVECTYWDNNQDFYGKWHSKEQFIQSMTIEESDKWAIKKIFAKDEVKHNRNMYYLMVNTVESIIGNGFNEWPIIFMNLFFVMVAELLMVALMRRMEVSEIAVEAMLVLFGLSAGGVSVVLYQRAYAFSILLVTVAIYLLHLLINEKLIIKKIAFALALIVTGWVSYYAHLFAFMMCVFVLVSVAVFIIKRRKELIIPAILSLTIIMYYIIRRNESLFMIMYNSIISDGIGVKLENMVAVNRVLSNHIYLNVFLVVILSVSGVKSSKRHKDTLNCRYLVSVGMALGMFYLMLALSGAGVWWKYTSITYLLLSSVIASLVFASERENGRWKALKFILICGMTFFTLSNVSELFVGYGEDKLFFEKKYSQMEGLFVHADTAGENYLYDAAYLWPEKARVYVEHQSDFYNRNYDKLFTEPQILLWTTIDYDGDMMAREFIEKSRYSSAEKVFGSQTLNVYLCSE